MISMNGEEEYRMGMELISKPSNTNVREAMEYFIKAADKGHIEALYQVGYYNIYGEPQIRTNFKWASECYQKCVDEGLSIAKYGMSYLYLYGIGVEKDEKKAYELLEAAYKEGIYEAPNMLSYCCWKGIGTDKDIEKAREYNEIARQRRLPGAEIASLQLHVNSGM